MSNLATKDDKLLQGKRAYTLFILVVVYTFNFIDRQIVGILAVPIKADLGLTDTQLGLMGGLAFALFYTGLPVDLEHGCAVEGADEQALIGEHELLVMLNAKIIYPEGIVVAAGTNRRRIRHFVV